MCGFFSSSTTMFPTRATFCIEMKRFDNTRTSECYASLNAFVCLERNGLFAQVSDLFTICCHKSQWWCFAFFLRRDVRARCQVNRSAQQKMIIIQRGQVSPLPLDWRNSCTKPASTLRGRHAWKINPKTGCIVLEFLRDVDHIKKTLWHINRKFQGDAFHGDISHVGKGANSVPLALQQHALQTERRCLDAKADSRISFTSLTSMTFSGERA